MGQNPEDMFGDEDYPAYTIGQAAEMLGTSQDFLRRLDEAKLIDPHRSAGGHRRAQSGRRVFLRTRSQALQQRFRARCAARHRLRVAR